MLSKTEVAAALEAAWNAAWVPSPAGGCGRAYVVVGGSRAEVNAVAAAAKKLGLTFLRKAYGVTGPALYVGYDNADGRALGHAKRVAEKLTELGLPSYFDAVAD